MTKLWCLLFHSKYHKENKDYWTGWAEINRTFYCKKCGQLHRT